ncbi:MAG TPA: fumarylacetoacetate hydrolase family protein [Vicinamibacterales bacterium]|nr:fumarylacetoacetate hydrolase family protein [Vicinamibacterales bacterium]
MKLARYGEPGAECPAVLLEDGTRVDVSSYVRDFDEAFFGGDGIEALGAWLAGPGRSAPKVPATSRIGCPIARPSKIVCIGLNFRDHAAESDMDLPKEPVIFFKASTALAGPNDPVRIPRGGTKLDWEVELAVVIGRAASYVDESHALDHVAGYALHNDYSERTFQLERGGQWVKGKSADTFAPIGPFLATRDAVKDPQSLDMWLTVNGTPRQRSTTANMIFGVANLVSYISQFMTLLPGDVISTGTPAGVGLGMKPEPMYLRAGDVVELGIDGLGQSRQEVIAHA